MGKSWEFWLDLAHHPGDYFAQVRAALAERDRVNPVGEHHLGHVADVVDAHLVGAVVGRLRLGGSSTDEVRTVAVDLEGDRDLGDQAQYLARQGDFGERRDGLRDLAPHRLLRFGVLLVEEIGVVLPDRALLNNRDALVDVADAFYVDTQPEPVEQLWAQLSFLGVHGADQDEPGRVRDRDALALHRVDAHRGSIEEDVDDVVVEQVDLVDIEDVAVRLRQHAWLEPARPLFQGRLEVDGADDAILRSVD